MWRFVGLVIALLALQATVPYLHPGLRVALQLLDIVPYHEEWEYNETRSAWDLYVHRRRRRTHRRRWSKR